MKKIYLITMVTSIFIFFINIETTFAQWTTQTSPLGTEILGKMQFVSSTEGWIACGNSGSLLHTTNAGTQWNVVTPFPDDTPMSNPSDVGLTMSWPNATHGWALKTYGSFDNPNGATLYQTVNAGTNWTKKDFPQLVASVTYSAADLVGTWQMHALNIDNPADASINNGFVRGTVTVDLNGNSITDYTDNKGQIGSRNSTAATINSKGIITLSGTDVHGFMSADKKTIIYTQSAGTTGYMLIVWQKVNVSTVYSTADLQGSWKMHSIQTQSNAGWTYATITMDATGNGTVIGHGPNNNQFNNSFSGSLSSIGILTSGGTDLNGYMSADKQTIYLTQSQNGGYCFTVLQKAVPETTYSAADLVGIWQLHGVAIGNSSAAWIHCQYKINASGSVAATKMSRNNVTMSDVSSTISISSDGTLTGFGTTTANGFLSADKSIGINTLTDGSGSFYLSIYQKDLSVSGDGGLQVQFADNNTGWASVYNALYGSFKLYKTTNGGTTWDVINGIENPVGGFYYFVDALNGWMFGASASTSGTNTDILHTTNGGLSWTTQATNVGSPKAVFFSDVLHGWVVGRNALLMKTVDGGTNWTTLTNTNQNSASQFRSVYALNANVCYFGSSVSGTSDEYILKTTNGGSSWTPIQVPFQYSVFNVVFWDENNGWISGDYGEIAHYSNNTEIQNPLGKDIFESVFPNPANDFIKIKGEFEKSNVKIYDISGNCVLDKSLEDDNKIDVRKLSVGIYFIKLPDLDKSRYIRFIKK